MVSFVVYNGQNLNSPLRHHFDCFWIKKRNALTEAAIRGFEALRWEDQQRIRDRLNPLSIPDVAVTETKTQAPSAGLSVEHAKSSSGKCTDCKEKIVKDSLRVKLKSKFYHPACLAKLALFSGTVNDIVGIDSLNEEELAELKTAFLVKAELDGPSSPKKARLSDNPERLEALKVSS
jgi:poly [ADP-ribose] polymerase